METFPHLLANHSLTKSTPEELTSQANGFQDSHTQKPYFLAPFWGILPSFSCISDLQALVVIVSPLGTSGLALVSSAL